MAFAWSAALNPTQISRQHGSPGRDMQALVLTQEQKGQYSFSKLRQKGIKQKQKGSIVLRASIGESVEEKDTDSGKDKEPLETSSQADATKAPSVSAASPFVGAKISSRIAAKTGDTANGRGTTTTTIPTTPKSSKTPPGSLGLPPLDFNTPRSQGSSTFSPKPPGPQTFSPKPPSSQGSPFSSPLAGADMLKGAKPSVFLDPKAGSGFKKPGSQSLLDNIRQSDKTTKFGQPVVPKNLFDEPDKLPIEEKKFEFTFNAGQLILVFSFLTIVLVMLGTAYVVWKVGAIHYNEF